MTSAPSANDLTRQQLEELDALLQRMLAAPGPKPEIPSSLPAVPPVVESWRIDRPTVPAPRLHFAMPPAPEPMPTYVPTEPPLPPTAPAASLSEIDLEDAVAVTPAEPFFLAPESVPEAGPPSFPRLDTITPLPLVAPATPSREFEQKEAVAELPAEPVVPAAESIPEAGPPSFTRFESTPIELMPSPDPEPTTTIETPVAVPATSGGIPLALWPIFAVNWVAEECLKAFGCEALTRPAAKWLMAGLGVLMLAAAAAWTLQGYGIVSLPIK